MSVSGGVTGTTTSSLDDDIASARGEVETTRTAKAESDRRFADADGRLTALLNLQRDIDKATQAYRAAYPQLTIDQQGFHDRYEQEEESLRELLGAAVATVRTKVDDRRKADGRAAWAVLVARSAVAAEERARARAERVRSARADDVARLNRLPAAVTALHAKLKAQRDEEDKARQGGRYALAYWLLVYRDFRDLLTESGTLLRITPDGLPDALRAAVTALADAHADEAEAADALAAAKDRLAAAESAYAEQKANGETRLREQLATITPAAAVAAAR